MKLTFMQHTLVYRLNKRKEESKKEESCRWEKRLKSSLQHAVFMNVVYYGKTKALYGSEMCEISLYRSLKVRYLVEKT